MKARLAFISAVAVLSLAFATPAFAYGPNAPSSSSSSSSVAPGGSLTFSGSNFTPGATVTATLHSTPVTLGTTTAGSSGSFSMVVTIPSDTVPGAHTLIATDPDGDSASTAIVVTGTVTVATTSSGLAFTGADIAALSGVGALAMALGGMLILTGRRRRQTA